MKDLDRAYVEKYGADPADNPNLVYFLGDNPSWAKTWSASRGKLPTFRRNNGFYLSRPSFKIMTPGDKLAALGWPVTSGTAAAMMTTKFPSLDSRRGGLVAGNAMHLGNSGIVLLVGLVCFGRQFDD